MKKQKIATVVTCCALVGAVAVGGTLALVTSTAKTMTNTFTVGNGYSATDFKLYENGVDLIASDAVATSKNRNVGDYVLNSTVKKDADATVADDRGNTYGSVIPGATLDKNPWFELTEGSGAPESWVVARVSVTELAALNDAGITIEEVGTSNGWHAVYKDNNSVWKYDTNPVTKESFGADSDKAVDGYLYFVYDTTIDTSTSTTGIDDHTDPLFTQLKADDANLDTISGATLDIQGVAVQKLGDATSPEAAIDTIMTDATGVLG